MASMKSSSAPPPPPGKSEALLMHLPPPSSQSQAPEIGKLQPDVSFQVIEVGAIRVFSVDRQPRWLGSW